jgi:hypothetical protein
LQAGSGESEIDLAALRADQLRDEMLFFLEFDGTPLNELRNLVDHFPVSLSAGDFEAPMPALWQIDTEAACRLGSARFSDNPQFRVSGFPRFHEWGFPLFHIRGFPVSLNAWMAAASILTRATTFERGDHFSR